MDKQPQDEKTEGPDEKRTVDKSKGEYTEQYSPFDVVVPPYMLDMRGIQNIDDLQEREEDKQLKRSIQSEGLLQPPVVYRDKEGRPVLVAGLRRLAALRALRRSTVPLIVKNDADEMTTFAENLQRAAANPIGEGHVLKAFIEANPDMTYEAIARRLKVKGSKDWISKRVRLLEAPVFVRDAVASGELALDSAYHVHAAEIAAQEREDLFHKAIEEKLKRSAIDAEIAKLKGETPASKPRLAPQCACEDCAAEPDNVITVKVCKDHIQNLAPLRVEVT